MATIAGLTGEQYLAGTADFDKHREQYATSTYGEERDLKPALIVKPKSQEDIALVLKYAKEQGVAVAIRTGGHQYSGASSTGGPNIQMDLSQSFKSPDDRKLWRKDGKAFARVSVSWSVGDFSDWLGSNNCFVPTGQCNEVYLGGHVQTGGYGQLLRSFGLLGDHVLSLEIIDADGNFKEVTKENTPDLFWALLGGSPGNLGVVTHFTLKVNQDEDYAGSRGLKALYFYSPTVLKHLMDILVEMTDDENFPKNYDFCVSVLSSGYSIGDSAPELCEMMSRYFPHLFDASGNINMPRAIMVYAQYVPFDKDDKCNMEWFDRIKEGAGWVDGDGHLSEKPMSKLTNDWIFRSVREFDKPYVKRTYNSKSRSLTKDGWAEWVTKRIDEIVSPDDNDCFISAQLQCIGGKDSVFATNADNGTSFSWRDATIGCTIDCFYNPAGKERAEEWQRVNDLEAVGPNGTYSKTDRRVLWGSYGNWDMDNVWKCYYEDQEKYDKLREIRKSADPYGTFTPNPFCVKRAD